MAYFSYQRTVITLVTSRDEQLREANAKYQRRWKRRHTEEIIQLNVTAADLQDRLALSERLVQDLLRLQMMLSANLVRMMLKRNGRWKVILSTSHSFFNCILDRVTRDGYVFFY